MRKPCGARLRPAIVMIAALWARWEKSPYLRHYRELQRTQFDPPERVQARQFDAVTALVHHAYANSTYWRRRFDEAAIRPRDIQSFADFRRVPVLTKLDLRAHVDDMLARGYQRS